MVIDTKLRELKLFLSPILFHGKLSFDNLNYFKLYGNLNKNLLNKDHFDSLDQFYTDLLLKSCQGRQKLL